MKRMNKDKLIKMAETLFLIMFFVFSFLGFNNITFGKSIISWIMWPSFLLGALLLLVRLWNWKHYIKTPGLILLVAMCVICVISIGLNLRYDLKDNFIYLIYWAFYFFMFYAQDNRATAEQVKKPFHIAGHIFNVGAFVLALISLLMMYDNFSEIVNILDSRVIRGFTHGRLYGAHLSPNHGAIIGGMAIVLSVYFMGKYRSFAYTAFGVVNILIQFLYIVFSDSRSGTLCLTAGLTLYVFFAAAFSSRLKTLKLRKLIIAFVTVATAACVLFAPGITQDIYNDYALSRRTPPVTTTAPTTPEPTTPAPTTPAPTTPELTTPAPKPDKDKQPPVIDRGYDLSQDISNRRFDVWKSGFEIFKERPLFGLTFRGFLPYAIENMPDTYIVANDHRQMDTLDSDIMNLLVSNGIFSLIAFIAFTVWVLIYLLRRVFSMERKDPAVPAMMGICASAAVCSLTSSGVLYMRCPFSILFWLSLGALTVIVKKGEDHE